MLLIDENGNIQRLDDPPERYDLPEWQEYNRLYDHMEQQGTGSIDEMRSASARYRETAKRAPWWRGWFLAIACLVGGRLYPRESLLRTTLRKERRKTYTVVLAAQTFS